MKDRKLSNVEMTVLGMTWLRAPCTIYAVMKELSTSASTYHKSRAGTAYLTSKRLLEMRLIEKIENDLVQLTPAGEKTLRDWTGPDVPMIDVAHSADLLRLRFFFIGILPPEQRLEFVDKSLASLRLFLERGKGLISQNEEIGDYYGALATVCLVLETKARIQWLEIVREWVANPMSENANWSETILESLDSQS